MRRRFPEQLSNGLLRKALLSNGEAMAKHLTENAVFDAWRKVLGPLSAYASGMEVREGMLYVHISSPMLRNDLFLQRTVLIEKLNAEVGHKALRGIVFR